MSDRSSPFESPVVITTGAEAAALDAAAIDSGTPSRVLMQRAGAAAAGEIALRLGHRLRGGVAVFAGPGNNGGDAWVVARALAASGVDVRVAEAAGANTQDAQAERELALAVLTPLEPSGRESVVIDGLLGTGFSGVPRGAVADSISRIRAMGVGGASVVALDVPSGVDATSGGSERAVRADLTLTFGTLKRGLLVARDACGLIVVLDIGLDARRRAPRGAPRLVDGRILRDHVPEIGAAAHKGSRKKLAIVGGGEGMAGAAVLAARAAMRTGVGMVRLVVAPVSVSPAQAAVPEALARPWPGGEEDIARDIVGWGDGLLLGPGLGASPQTRALTDALLKQWSGPVVLDADALNVYEGDAAALAARLVGRPALITPHVAEFARLAGCEASEVLERPFEAASDLARRLGAAVLLKGVPTIVASSAGDVLVSAAGTPALAQAGSGDLLSGIAATLLVQTGDPLRAGACAAWVHGRAAERAGRARDVRGIPLRAITSAIGRVWGEDVAAPRYPVLAELPAVGERRPPSGC